jgi:hypothetical protein
MDRISKMALLLLVIILSLLGTFLSFKSSNVELVANGSFEDGKQGWLPAPHPAKGGVDIFRNITGSHSLRLIGTGDGLLQRFNQTDIYPRMQLGFDTFLNATPGQILPEALFHLYFVPEPNAPVAYYVDITVTLLNNEDLGAVFEPNPGVDTGGIYLRFNREPPNTWIHISVDVSALIERNFPDFYEPQVKRIMLESAEEGKVYFDNISLNSTNYGYLQSVWLVSNSIANGTLTKTIAQLLSFSVIGGACVQAYHWLKHRGKEEGRSKRKKEGR